LVAGFALPYELEVQLLRQDAVFDSYGLPIGIRTAKVHGNQLLLSGWVIHDFTLCYRGMVKALQRLGHST